MNASTILRVSALFGFLAVTLGAFGAHGLKTTLEANNHAATWETAAHYHLMHAVALVALALHPGRRIWTWRLWFWGTVLFSGSLYVLALTKMKWLVAITPIGGTVILAGWLALAFERERTVG